MRTSLNEIKKIEDYLSGQMTTSDSIVFEAATLTNLSLKQKVEWQGQVYQVIKLFGRKKLSAEINAIEEKVFSDNKFASFQKSVGQIFNQ